MEETPEISSTCVSASEFVFTKFTVMPMASLKRVSFLLKPVQCGTEAIYDTHSCYTYSYCTASTLTPFQYGTSVHTSYC